MTTELTDAERLKLIRRSFEFCAGDYSDDDVAEQFHHETGRWPEGGSRKAKAARDGEGSQGRVETAAGEAGKKDRAGRAE